MPKIIKDKEVQETDVRDLAIRKFDSYGNYHIYRERGGMVPVALSGIYTTPNKAQAALDAHLEVEGFINEANKIKAEIKTIHELDHTTYDDDVLV